ncbi:uncharacterized protein LOC144608446 [Rhinoraja longicauda]
MAEWQRFYSVVDETLCDHVVCQHPMCWATFRRLERGLPRIRIQPIRKFSPEKSVDLPPLNILELPQWSADKAVDVSSAPIISRKTALSAQSYKSSHPDILRPTSVMGTSLGSSMECERFTRSRSCSPPSRDRPVSVRKVEMIDLHQQPSTCDQYMGKTMFFWVPNPRNKRKWQKKQAKSITPKSVSIKEISFQGQPYDELEGLSVEQKERQKMRKKAKTKAPTGGQPYTFLARKQQSLMRWKDTQKQLYKEHSNEPMEMAQQPDHSDLVAEQGLTQQYSAAKSQPAYNRNEYQNAKKIPANIMPMPVSKKVTLHHFTEKQKQIRSPGYFRGLSRRKEQHLECKYFGINRLKLQKCIDNNLSAFQDNIESDQGKEVVHPPSPASSINDECAQQCSDVLAVRSISVHAVDSRFFRRVQVDLLMNLPGTSMITSPMYPQKNGLLTVSTGKVQRIKDQTAHDITLTGLSAMEPTASRDQNGIFVDTPRKQQDRSFAIAIEVVTPTLKQAGSADQSSVPVGGQDQQQQLSAASEVGPPLEQVGSEDQGRLPDDQQDLSTATEVGPPTTEQVGSEDQGRLPDDQQDLNTATEVGPPTTEQVGPEDQGRLPDDQQDLSTATEVGPPITEQVGSEDQGRLPDDQQDLNAATEVGPPAMEQARSEDQGGLPDDQQDLRAAAEVGPPAMEQARSEDQGGLPIAKPEDQQDLGAATEAAPPMTKRGDSEEQSNLPTIERDELPEQELAGAGMNEQEDLSATAETESPRVDQGAEDQRALPTAERNEEQDLGAATETTALIGEQGDHEMSEDPQNEFTIAKSVEGQDSEAPV